MRRLLFLTVVWVILLMIPTTGRAETKVQLKGFYRVRYFQLENFGRGGINYPVKDGANGLQADHLGYFDQMFRIEPRFIVSDCLEVRMRIHALFSNRWGTADSLGKNGSKGSSYIAWDSNGPYESEFVLDRIYGVIKTSWGRWRVGRMGIGVFGLDLLGYNGGRFKKAARYLAVMPFDWDYDGHRIMWDKKWGNFSLTAGYQKDIERDSANQGAQAMNAAPANAPAGAPGQAASAGYDDDQDQFFILPAYEWKTGAVNFRVNYIRSRAWNEEGGPGYNPLKWNTPLHANVNSGGQSGYKNVAEDWDAWMLNPAVILNFGPVALHGEFAYLMAEFRPDRTIYPDEDAMPDVQARGWGIWLDGAYNYGRGEAGAMFSYLGGRNFDDQAADDTMEGILGIGDVGSHTPFLVAYDRGLFNRMTLMNTGPFPNSNKPTNYSTWNNHWMIGAYNDFSLTEDVILHASLGYFQLVNVPYAAGLDYKKDLGVELDFGAFFKVMDHLDLSSTFGYFWTGNAWKYGVDSVELGNAWAWRNQLLITF